MKQFRFVFLVKVRDHDSSKHRVTMETPTCRTIMIGVKDLQDACEQAKQLVEKNEVDKIELCGGFKEEGAKAVSECINRKVPVGYVVDLKH